MGDQTQEQTGKKTKRHNHGRGGVVAGWILMILGVLFLLNNFYILDFEKFWPLVLIAIGIIILVKRSSRGNSADLTSGASATEEEKSQ